MLEQMNLSQSEAIEIANSFPVEPLFGQVVITINKDEADGNLILSDNVMSEIQYVIAKGEHVRHLELGQKVIINLSKLMSRERNPQNQDEILEGVKIEPLLIDGRLYAIIEDRIIKCKYKELD